MKSRADDEFRCPRCLNPHMSEQVWGGAPVRICMKCGANFFSAGALAGFEGWAEDVPAAAECCAKHGATAVHCPACATVLERIEFPLEVPLDIERCPRCHGILLDFEEIRRVPEIGAWAKRTIAERSGAEGAGR
ncbi:MAG: zf-TFIIB domain-containing protein [Planctomycetota bacterium]